MKNVQTKAPGKLYIAGEYAVVEPGHSAVITAVDSFVTVSISPSETKQGSISSKGFTDEPIKWSRVENQVTLEHSGEKLTYVLAAIRTTEEYLLEQDISLVHFDLGIESDLDNASGKKFGLGSSGAVTVATVQSLLTFYGVEFSDLVVYKLSVLAQMGLGVNSSFGDIAASTYTGWIQYSSFDRGFVQHYRKRHTLSETIEFYWSKLIIKRITPPKNAQLLVGWTGIPASSHDLVGAVQTKKEQSAKQYDYFLDESNASVDLLVMGLENNNPTQIKQAIQRNREALVQMGQETNVLIETPLLTQLCEIANKHGGAAKTSGAGGGDSGVAFIFDKKNHQKIVNEWKNVGITPLPLSIHTKK